jgi:hypothetical protein
MRFIFTMHMPSVSGNLVHQIIGDHPAQSLAELAMELSSCDFLVVNEFYKDDSAGRSGLASRGPISLNCMHIGKIKEFV